MASFLCLALTQTTPTCRFEIERVIVNPGISCFVSVMLLGCGLPATCQTIPDDALTVRAVYGKLMIASRLRAILERNFPSADRSLIHVSLSDLKTGPVSEILATPYSELVSKPSGLVLSAGMGTTSYTDPSGASARTTSVSATWNDAQSFTEDWNFPMARALDIVGLNYTRYASFHVTLSFQGRERQYAAMFLFAKDEGGRTKLFLLDQIVGSALNDFVDASVAPGILLLHPDVDQPEVRAFIESMAGPSGCEIDPVSRVCCGPSPDQCGLAPQDQVRLGPILECKSN